MEAGDLVFDGGSTVVTPQTKPFWIYDRRTTRNLMLRANPLAVADLADFVACYHPENRHVRRETARYHAFGCEELVRRDKASFDLF